MATGEFEKQETKVFRSLIAESDVLVNVGANIGYYCCHSLDLGKSVIAIEPVPRNMNYLLRNIEENGWAKRAEVFQTAAGPDCDIVNIYGGATGASLIKGWAGISPNYCSKSPMLTLDRIAADSLNSQRILILIDVEGAEHLVLEGAEKLLSMTPRPTWIVEITTVENQPEDTPINPYFESIFQKFFALGYRAFSINDVSTPITPNQVNDWASGRLAPDCYNFVFQGAENPILE